MLKWTGLGNIPGYLQLSRGASQNSSPSQVHIKGTDIFKGSIQRPVLEGGDVCESQHVGGWLTPWKMWGLSAGLKREPPSWWSAGRMEGGNVGRYLTWGLTWVGVRGVRAATNSMHLLVLTNKSFPCPRCAPTGAGDNRGMC